MVCSGCYVKALRSYNNKPGSKKIKIIAFSLCSFLSNPHPDVDMA